MGTGNPSSASSVTVPGPESWVPMYASYIKDYSAKYILDPFLVTAVIWQESNGGIAPETGVHSLSMLYRYEPGFWEKYLAPQPSLFPCPQGVSLETWKRRISASYGLMQVMYPTAKLLGFDCEPEALLDPDCGMDWGCEALAHAFTRSTAVTTQSLTYRALLRYNGGGNLRYPAEVEYKVGLLKGMNLGIT